MNPKYLIAALAPLLGSSVAFARAEPPTGGVTRAQVMAEIVQARADGTLPLSEAAYLQNQLAPIKSTQSSDAQRHTRADRKNAPVDADSGITPAAPPAGVK
jgi:hypothetical protein